MTGHSGVPVNAVVVRPDLATARAGGQAGRGAALASVLAFTSTGLAFGLRSGAWLFAVGFFGGAAFLLAHLALYFRNASVFATETTFGKTTALGLLRIRDRSQLARVVLARVSYGARYGPGRPEMYFLDRKGKALLVVKGSGWPAEKLALLWRCLGVAPEGSFARATTLDEISSTVPVAWVRRWAGLVAFLTMLVLVFGLAALLGHFGIHIRR